MDTKQPETSRLQSLKEDLIRIEQGLVNRELHANSMDNQYKLIHKLKIKINQLELNRNQV
jgi:hypothetical protein